MIYKLRFNCVSFEDIVVEATNKEDAKREASRIIGCSCPQNGMEFGEFLELEKDDTPEN